MSCKRLDDDGDSVKLSVGFGGGDPHDPSLHWAGLDIETPLVQLVTTGQKIGIAVIAILLMLCGGCQLYQTNAGGG